MARPVTGSGTPGKGAYFLFLETYLSVPRKHAHFGDQVIPAGEQLKVENKESYLKLECTMG